jgi:DNA-binding transcriptional LysR family regulator
LSGASRQLSVEHSTVARRVGQLEAALSIRLFDRLARGWTLTVEGHDLFGRAEAVEREVMALRRVSADMDALAGTVRISAPPLILAHLLLPGLRGLRTEHPGLMLDLIGA